MSNPMASELSRRGFVVLAASAFGAFFIKPALANADAPSKEYLVSVQTTGYGYGWSDEAEEDDDYMEFFEPDAAEVQRESLAAGAILRFKQDPELPEDAIWLDVVSPDGEKLCDIPWSGDPHEMDTVKRIVDKINDGRDIWGEVTDVEHSTIDAGDGYARIHRIDFDVFFR